VKAPELVFDCCFYCSVVAFFAGVVVALVGVGVSWL
jgi:hypothetical protein